MQNLSQGAYRRLLAGGSLLFAAYALLLPDRLARLIGGDETIARELGIRDLGAAVTLLAAPNPRGAFATRVLYDVSDAVLFGRGRPKVAAMALGFAALGVGALAARDSG